MKKMDLSKDYYDAYTIVERELEAVVINKKPDKTDKNNKNVVTFDGILYIEPIYDAQMINKS